VLRRIALGLGAASLALSMSAGITLASQPGAECDSGTVTPHGFTVDGFAITADGHYANLLSTGGVQSGNGHVVSQYDIACFHP
jgi:hypothetical protein